MRDARNCEVQKGDSILIHGWGATLKEGIFEEHVEDEKRVRYWNPETARLNSFLEHNAKMYKVPARGQG